MLASPSTPRLSFSRTHTFLLSRSRLLYQTPASPSTSSFRIGRVLPRGHDGDWQRTAVCVGGGGDDSARLWLFGAWANRAAEKWLRGGIVWAKVAGGVGSWGQAFRSPFMLGNPARGSCDSKAKLWCRIGIYVCLHTQVLLTNAARVCAVTTPLPIIGRTSR